MGDSNHSTDEAAKRRIPKERRIRGYKDDNYPNKSNITTTSADSWVHRQLQLIKRIFPETVSFLPSRCPIALFVVVFLGCLGGGPLSPYLKEEDTFSVNRYKGSWGTKRK